MFVVMNRIAVNPAYAAQFEERFADRAALVDGMDGFVSFQLLRPGTEGAPYVVMTVWETRAHFDAWTESNEFKQGHAQTGRLPHDAFRGRPTLEVFETILAAGKGEILPDA